LRPVPFVQRRLASAAVGLGRDAAGEPASTQELSDERRADAEAFGDLHARCGPVVARRNDPLPQVK
jgi:hypothetical protein